MENRNKTGRGFSLMLLFATFSAAATTALYSFIGTTDDYGNFRVNRTYQLFLILATLVLAFMTIRSFFQKKK